jgi:hypothetical protein
MQTLRDTRPLYLVCAILCAMLALIFAVAPGGRPLVAAACGLLALALLLTFGLAGRALPLQP